MLQVGDKLLAVGDVQLEQVSHEQAVATLKSTGEHVLLTVAKTSHHLPPPPPVPPDLGNRKCASFNFEPIIHSILWLTK